MTTNTNDLTPEKKFSKKKLSVDDILSGVAVIAFILLFIGVLVGIFLIGLNLDNWILPLLAFPVPTHLQEASNMLCLIIAVFLDVIILAKLLKTSLITID